MKKAPHIICNLCHTEVKNTLYDFGEHSIVKCQKCGLVINTDLVQLSKEKLHAEYNTEAAWLEDPFLNWQVIDYQENERVKLWKKQLKKLENYKPAKGKLLDIGCATGVFLDIARNNGWQTKGVEISSYMSEYARDKFKLDVITGTLEEAHLADENYDVVTMWDVIEHLTKPVEVVAEVHRILKHGGLLVISTPNFSSPIYTIIHLIYKLSPRRIAIPFLKRIYGSTSHKYFFTSKTLGRLLLTHNFNVSNVSCEVDFIGTGQSRLTRVSLRLIDTLLGSLLNKRHRLIVTVQKPAT